MLNLYITSTNKQEGKTFITSGLAATMQSLGYSTTVYKPIQTNGIEHDGFMQSPDLTYVKTIDPYINTHFSYLYKTNSEPLIASEIENEPIDLDLIQREYLRIASISECAILDGDSGLLSPIAPNILNVHLIKKLQIPVLVVVSPSENSVNDILLSIFAAQENDLIIRGIIINCAKKEFSKMQIGVLARIVEEYTNTKILGIIPYLNEKVSPEDLISTMLNSVDIEKVFDVKIEKLEL